MTDEHDGASEPTENEWTAPHEHNRGAAGAPGASAPGEQGYEGDVQVSAMGADVDREPGAYADPTGRPDTAGDQLRAEQIPEQTRRAWERADRAESEER